jgi:hypothetical protein
MAATPSRTLSEDLLRPLGEKPDPKNQAYLTELHYDFSREYSLPRLVGAFFKTDTNPQE